MSAGVDFLTNWLLEDQDYKTAFNNIAWGAAALDGITTASISLFIDGTGTTKTLAKLAKSKGGRLAIDVVQSMVVNITAKLETGDLSISDIDLPTEFLEATFTTLLSKGLSKKADELLESLKGSNKELYAKLSKLQRNTEAGKSKARLKSDKTKVETARSNANANARRYAKEKTKVKGQTAVLTETAKAINSGSDSGKQNKR